MHFKNCREHCTFLTFRLWPTTILHMSLFWWLMNKWILMQQCCWHDGGKGCICPELKYGWWRMNQQKWHSQLHHVSLCSCPRWRRLSSPTNQSDSKEKKLTSGSAATPDSWKLAEPESEGPNSRAGEGEMRFKQMPLIYPSGVNRVILFIWIDRIYSAKNKQTKKKTC